MMSTTHHHHPHHHSRVMPHSGPPTHHEKLIKNAQKVVSQTFFGTMLKQMHNSPFKSKIFSGGRGGEAFGSLLDQRLADHMASGAAGNLVDTMVDRWEHPRPAANAAAAAHQQAQETHLKNGYGTTPATEWRRYVPANLRA
jgi:Rod binding domain-containing protein